MTHSKKYLNMFKQSEIIVLYLLIIIILGQIQMLPHIPQRQQQAVSINIAKYITSFIFKKCIILLINE